MHMQRINTNISDTQDEFSGHLKDFQTSEVIVNLFRLSESLLRTLVHALDMLKWFIC